MPQMQENVVDTAEVTVAPSGRANKHLRWPQRACKACLSCRSRKVRCDALLRRPGPCTNCDLNGTSCTLMPKRPRGRPRLSVASGDKPALAERNHQPDSFSIISYHSPASLVATTSSSCATDTDCSQRPAQSNAEPTETSLAFDFPGPFDSGAIEPLSHRSSTLMSDYVDLDGCRIDDILFVGDANIIDSAFDFGSGRHNPLRGGISPEDLFPSPPSANDILNENDAGSMEFKSPFPWLCDWTPSVHVNQESWKKLHDIGALTLPGVDTLKKLLRLFFTYFHPSFPVLSEHVFHRIYQSISASKQLVSDGEDDCFPRMSLAMLKATMFIASAFVDDEDATNEGFLSIRDMSQQYYSQAEALYELGCQSDGLDCIQLCILLSMQRSYMNECSVNEQWIIRALDHMNGMDIISKCNDDLASQAQSCRWRRIYACWYLRAVGLVIGLKNTSRPEIIEMPAPRLSLSDMEEECQFHSFLAAKTKRSGFEYFIARVELFVDSIGLCKVLLDRFQQRVDRFAESGRVPPPQRLQRSSLGQIEDTELCLREWRARHDHLFMPGSPLNADKTSDLGLDGDCSDRNALCIAHSMLKLSFEYVISTLHLTALSSDCSPLSSWASMIRESSVKVLWESVRNTMQVFRCLHSQGLVKMMPVTAIVFIFIPLNLYYLSLKTGVHYDPASLSDLSVCASSLQHLAERYPVSDFFEEIMDASLSLLHETMANSNSIQTQRQQQLQQPRGQRWYQQPFPISEKQSESMDAPLPSSQVHAAIIRFQDLSLATGSIRTAKLGFLLFGDKV